MPWLGTLPTASCLLHTRLGKIKQSPVYQIAFPSKDGEATEARTLGECPEAEWVQSIGPVCSVQRATRSGRVQSFSRLGLRQGWIAEVLGRRE